jgi:ATP-dependent DNA helicase RecG
LTSEEVYELIAEIQRHRTELQAVEVKAAGGGTPLRAVRESLSAFSNRTGGGALLFGIDEDAGFKIVGVPNPQRLQEEVSNIAANEVIPALRPEFTVVHVDGKSIVAVEIPEISGSMKPCYVKANGLQGGSFIRVGLSNRRMTDYEVFGYVSAREQPKFDGAPVPEAGVGDLDRAKIESYIAALRKQRSRGLPLDRSPEELIVQLNIAKTVDGRLLPTLAGLLAFGVFPQTFEPQLVVTFLHYFGTDETEKTPRGERFLDNRKFEGTLVEIIEDAVSHVLGSIRKSSLIHGLFRRDVYEYPEEAIREAVVNAIAHRDYSHYVRGSYVQIRLFADRLEIQSPGGLYGNVTEETIEEEQSTRNRVLVRFLEDLRLVENRGSGIKAMIGAMRDANLEPPKFEDRRSSFWVTFRNHTLMDQETIAWLNQFANHPLNDHQLVALAYLRRNDNLSNSDYRRLNHVDTGTATKDLRGLVHSGLCVQHGSGRWTNYCLSPSALLSNPVVETDEERILAYVRERGAITNLETQTLLAIPPRRAKTILTGMRRRGLLRLEGTGRWSVYRLATRQPLG